METNRVNVRNCKLLLRIPLLLKCIDTLENGNFSEYAVSRRGLGDGNFKKSLCQFMSNTETTYSKSVKNATAITCNNLLCSERLSVDFWLFLLKCSRIIMKEKLFYKIAYLGNVIPWKDASGEGECRNVMHNMVCSFCPMIT